MAAGFSRHSDEEVAREESKYYDILYNFTCVIQKLNKKALDGEEPKRIEKRICKLFPAFTMLCGMDSDGNIDISKVKASKKVDKPKKAKTVLQSNLIVRDGWGLCPKCGKKSVKVNLDTILVNHPMFCKVCKKEYIVTWRYEKK